MTKDPKTERETKRAARGADETPTRCQLLESFLDARKQAPDDPLAGVPQLAVAAGLARLEVNRTNRRLVLEYARLKPALECAISASRNIADLLCGAESEPPAKGEQQDSKREATTPRELVDILTGALREANDTIELFQNERIDAPPQPTTLALEELDRLGIRSGARLIEEMNFEVGLTRDGLRNRVKQRRRRKTGK